MSDLNILASTLIVGQEIKKSDRSYFSLRKRNQRIELRTYNNICFLEKGTVSVYRLENNILTITLTAPAILGLAQMRQDVKSHYLRCDNDCEMTVISTSDAIELFNEKLLWKHAFDLLTYHLHKYFQRESLISHKTSRDIVVEHLKHIWKLPHEIREKTSVFSFILNRNHISRSMVSKILKELENEGVLTMSRGKLLSIKDGDDM
ncbi:helix-turn-helix domain-containing protein [Salmonella enterica]|nr:transcriptional regulator [Salmonella enterica]EGA0602492.1 transcriptional regulator [Salmonella enterica]EHD2148090.1 transcriptional regulator [Salmonella enterica]EHK2354311.1 helix-turn-helix domain-containing protein [Salmonella enterica]